MRPENQQQAIRHMDYLLKRKITGSRSTKVKEHRARARQIARVIWQRFQVGPYQYQLKHLIWYLDTWAQDLKPERKYRYWLTLRYIIYSLNKQEYWLLDLKHS